MNPRFDVFLELANNKKKYISNDEELLSKNFYSAMKGRINYVKMNKLQSYINNRQEPLEDDLKYLYKDALNVISSRTGKEIILDEGSCIPMFDPSKERQVWYVTGKSGSGKSRYIANLMKSYNKIYKNSRDIYVFSNKNEDKVFDGIKYIRIKLDKNLYEDQLTLEEIKKSLIIFDDIEFTGDKKIDLELERLKNLILNQGRDKEISFVLVSHVANNYSKTKNIFAELDVATIYPHTTSAYALNYLLGKYFGLDKKQIEKIRKLPSNWVTIFRDPFCIVYEKGCYLID